MATYTINFTIDDEVPGSSNPNQYPLLQLSSTFTPDNTLYFKQGDTIRVKHTHPEGLAITYTGSDSAPAGSAHPDPTPEGSQVSGYEWRQITWSGDLTDDSGNVTDSANDYETFWYFFASNSSGAFAYSQKLRLNKISITGSSLSASTVTQGNTVTFSVDNLTGLLPSSGSDGNRLFVYLQKDGSNFTTTGSGGVTWSAGSSYYGELTSSSTSVTLTVGASMPVGTYTAYVGHYNANGGESAGTGAGNRLDSSPPSFNVVAPGGTFGVEVKNASGNLVMGSTSRLQNLVIPPGSVTITPGTSLEDATEVLGTGNYQKAYIGTSSNISFPGLTSSNTGDFQIWVTDLDIESQADTIVGRFKKVYIERDTNQFRLRLETWFAGSSGAETYRYMGFRF